MLRKGQGTSKGQKSEVEDAPNGQSQSNLSSKINDDMIKYPWIWYKLIIKIHKCTTDNSSL